MNAAINALWVIGINAIAAALIVLAVTYWRNIRYVKEYATVITLVKAAEQLFGPQRGQDKLDYVITELGKVLPGLDYKLVRPMIEEAVLDLKQGIL